MYRHLSRRGFLSTTALAGAGLFAGARAASALTLAPMDAEAHRLFMDRCKIKGDAYHQSLLAEAKAKLSGTVSEKEMQAALAGLTCPVCGCPVATS